ncbi:MAG: hypothetical protein PHI40_02930 [Caldisericia bacterium]|nr:hypothetical protein [Caldisericia bacterium]MDD4614346.1 hypothetical protein [Caldisericia bacterium]
MQTLNIKKLISYLCGFLVALLMLFPFSGCNQTVTEETSHLQVCFSGPFQGKQFSDCTTTIQHNDLIHILQLKSNQIFSLKANKGFSADGFHATHDQEDSYYLHTVGSQLPIREHQNLVLDFDFANDSLLTLEILNPSITRIEEKIVGCTCYMSSDGLIVGHQDIQTRVVLHTPSPVPLLEMDSVYDMEVVDHRYLVVLSASSLPENDCVNKLSVYLIPDLMNNQVVPLYEKVFDPSPQDQNPYHHFLASNKQDLFAVLTYEDILETYSIREDEVVFVQEMPLSFSQDTDEPSTLKNVYTVCAPNSDQILVWSDSQEETDQYIEIIDMRANLEIQSVAIPEEGLFLEYAMPFSNEEEKGYFLFFENEEASQAIPTYLIVTE